MNVLLIAGHGNGDSGAVGNGYEEAELTREFAVLLKENLKSFCNVTLADTNRNWFEFLGSNNYDFDHDGFLTASDSSAIENFIYQKLGCSTN